MANPEKGEVEFRVGEKQFKIKLTTNGAAEASPYMNGKAIFDVNLQDMMCLRALLFVMSRGQNGIQTIDDAGDLIDSDPITCTKAVNEAAALFFQKWIQMTPNTPKSGSL